VTTTATKIAARMTERVVYGGRVENNVISYKDDYFNFKQKEIQSKSKFGSILSCLLSPCRYNSPV
jgi:hypothetical protein